MALKCYKCGNELSDSLNIMVSRSEICSVCRSDIRSCRMCTFFDPKAYNDCRESNADRVPDKEKANFCDYFKIGNTGSDEAEKIRQAQLAKAMELFKK